MTVLVSGNLVLHLHLSLHRSTIEKVLVRDLELCWLRTGQALIRNLLLMSTVAVRSKISWQVLFVPPFVVVLMT